MAPSAPSRETPSLPGCKGLAVLAGPGCPDPGALGPPTRPGPCCLVTTTPLPPPLPHPAAPIFSSGLIACQDLPNVSSSPRIFKRAPEAIFKQGGWGPMLMRGARSKLTVLPAASWPPSLWEPVVPAPRARTAPGVHFQAWVYQGFASS